ncbi:MAG: SpoIIE family protein phosphatase [Calditrichaceae bacterium]|nr:SpoIIE family protein phosphatase [Calditrichaceae bacterium]MBN2708058.1 SpoIIE family protein phosphatase [Calditrichaceae bacterium]RQV92299.1 MAG: GAF domain-containing protein [Calditrichota bacterium]
MIKFRFRLKIPAQFSLLITAILFVATFLYDLLVFYTSSQLWGWNYLHEALSAGAVYFFYLYLKANPVFAESNVQKNLALFLKLLGAFYLFVLITGFILRPVFDNSVFPPKALSVQTVIYINIVSIAGIMSMSYMLVVIKNLVYYKYKKRTNIYAFLALMFTLLSMLLAVYFETSKFISFSGNDIFSNLSLIIALIFIGLLSLRNSWVTYLSRKEKYSYFIISAFSVWAIYFLYDFAFQDALSAHSLALGVFMYIAWFFLVFYSTFTAINLLLHLPTARVFDRKMREVSSLHHLSRTISLEYDTKKLLDTVITMSSDVLESPYTWIELFDTHNKKFYVASSRNLSEQEIKELNNEADASLSYKITKDKKPLLINDLLKSDLFPVARKWNKAIGSLTGAPILSGKDKAFAVLYAAKTQIFGFDPDDVNMLEAYANQASIAMENAELLKTTFEQERLEKELQIAREVQLRLLPQDTPKYKHIQIEAMTITAYEVGGDYYDFYTYPDERFGMVIGDVSGKGTSAAFYMAETKGIIQSLARNYESPKEILIQTNNLLYSTMERKSFISLLAVRFDLNRQHVCFSRAGHCPVIYYDSSDKSTKLIQPHGIAIGLDRGGLFTKELEEYEIKIKPDDILAFYTDGLTEARNGKAEEFGEERLCQAIREKAHLNMQDLKNEILDRILSFLNESHLHDDLTLVLTKIQ